MTRLLADGYDARDLPLIVTYTDAATRSRQQAVPDGARKQRTLSSIQGAALSTNDTADFWRSLTAGSTARSTGAATFTGGIAKVWLDGKVKADLADTTAQIGAPEVWRGGNTGQGVDVAVLDTGIDAAHPDLAGRIAASTSFVPDQDVTDRHGHGTHVASTIAGTGAASGGKEKGVAPGAGLHIGKVLDNDGSGQDSWILAGHGVGRPRPARQGHQHEPRRRPDRRHRPDEPGRQRAQRGDRRAVRGRRRQLRPGHYSVTAPGAADAALTVGAVDGADQLADFSSRGPRVGDGGLKPDITAPGVDVLAARSQYAAEGEGSYQTDERHLDGDAARRGRRGPAGRGAPGLDRAAAQGRAGQHRQADPAVHPVSRPAAGGWTSPAASEGDRVRHRERRIPASTRSARRGRQDRRTRGHLHEHR